MNKKNFILGFILLAFIIGIVFSSFEIVKYIYFDLKGSEVQLKKHSIKLDELTFFQTILFVIYYFAVNGIGFTMIITLPLIPLFLFWNLYEKEGSLKRLWPIMIMFWGLYSEVIFITWGLQFLKHLRRHLSTREIVFNNLFLFFIITVFSFLLFHISFRIYNALSKRYLLFILINFLSLTCTAFVFRFFFTGYLEKPPQDYGGIKIFLTVFILFLTLILGFVFYERGVVIGKKRIPDELKSAPRFLSIPRLGMVSLYALIFLLGLACLGYYEENRQVAAGIHLKNNSGDISGRKGDLNAIIILVDALRADHLSSYGYKQKTSPNIDKLAHEGVLFANSFSQASWTKPSVASLFTSLYPTQHNANTFYDSIPDQAKTIAEILKEKGYLTAAFVTNVNVGKDFNFNQGFDLYCDDLIREKIYYLVLKNSFWGGIIGDISRNRFFAEDRATADVLNSLIIPWLENNKDKKFFLYLHYIDPHGPYNPPAPFYDKYADMLDDNIYKGFDKFDVNKTEISIYDGEIEFTDFQIGKLLETIDKLKLKDNTLIIFLSDHGEAFLEHDNKQHGTTLFDEETHIPLIMRLPGYIPAGMNVSSNVCTIDVMPTIFDILNIKYKGMMEGESLYPEIKGFLPKGKRNYIFCEELMKLGANPLMVSLRKGNYKYIFTKVPESQDKGTPRSEQLFDLKKDPGEFYNIVNQRTEDVSAMREKVDSLRNYFKKTSLSNAKVKVDEKIKDHLRALGYIQ